MWFKIGELARIENDGQYRTVKVLERRQTRGVLSRDLRTHYTVSDVATGRVQTLVSHWLLPLA
jgi:hypothetical protein